MLSSAPYQFGPIWARVHILLRADVGEGEGAVFHYFPSFPLIFICQKIPKTFEICVVFHKFIFKRKMFIPGPPQAPKNMLK